MLKELLSYRQKFIGKVIIPLSNVTRVEDYFRVEDTREDPKSS
jgi:hypothetical protein